MTRMRWLSLLCIVGCLIVQPLQAQIPGLPRIPGIGKDKDKQEKDRKNQVDRAAKDARLYDKLKEFSLDLYEKDLEFREEVDWHYADVRRDHSMDAFKRNIASPARPTVLHDGDRIRLQEGIYDNKLVQDYINRVGQRLVPENSEQLFAFRLIANPIPFAETLSTGTIYISTGLISLLDNEAQLAYVLGHEMAHVYEDHWKLKSVLDLGEDEYNRKQERRRKWFALAGAAAGGVAGAALGRSREDAALGAVIGAGGGYVASHFFIRGMNLEWDKVQEDRADQIAFESALRQHYDIHEVPKMYATLQQSTQRDARVAVGFMGSRRRVQERIDNVRDLIAGQFKEDLARQLGEGSLVGTSPDFAMVMSELKRDNGILAFYYDMFQLAKDNLEYAVSIRSNDPAAHYYYAKVLKLVARTPEDMRRADEEFQAAIRYDTRQRYYGAHFFRALHLMNRKDPSLNPEIVKSLQDYVKRHLTYTAEEARQVLYLPANLDGVYDYLAQAGEVQWTPAIPNDLPVTTVLTSNPSEGTGVISGSTAGSGAAKALGFGGTESAAKDTTAGAGATAEKKKP